MKRIIIFFIPILLAFAGCAKGVNNEITPITTIANTQGSVTVKCDNCKIDYGMPDQYHGYNVAGTSGTFTFNYKSGYTLQANIYALDQEQNITYTVYDTKSRIVYQNVATQSVEGFWEVNVLLP